MHKLFLQGNLDLQEDLKYWLCYEIFNTELNISFGHPRSDTCDTCKQQHVNTKAAELGGDVAAMKRLKIENELRFRKAEVFHEQLHKATERAKMSEEKNVVMLAIDFQKNLPLLLNGVSQEYYKRQLWVHNFCIHDCSKAVVLKLVEDIEPYKCRAGLHRTPSYNQEWILKILVGGCSFALG